MKNIIEIGGKTLHAAMMSEADKAIQGKGDGRISKADAERIAAHLTNTDKKLGTTSLQYIGKHYKLTSSAQAYFDLLVGTSTSKTTSIKNTTPFHIKIFEGNGNNEIGAFVHLLAPHATHTFQTIPGMSYVSTLALDRRFDVKTFTAGTATVSIAHEDLKSIPMPSNLKNEGYGPASELETQAANDSFHLYKMKIGGGESTKFTNSAAVDALSIYVQKSAHYKKVILGYYVTMLPFNKNIPQPPPPPHSGPPPIPPPPDYCFNPQNLPSPSDPNSNHFGYKVQTWYVPNYIKGRKTENGYTIDIGNSKGRLTNGGAGLHLYTGEVMICAQANFVEGSDFWILKGDCPNMDAFLRMSTNYKKDQKNNSIQLGPGTMVQLYSEPNHTGSEQEIGKNCNETNFSVYSFTVKNIEAPSSAGLTIHHELGEQYIDPTTGKKTTQAYYRTTIIANAFSPTKAAADKVKGGAMKPGRPTTLYIESSEPVEAIINGKSVPLSPFSPTSTTAVNFNKLGQVQILIEPTSKSIRVPNLFFYTDKMDSSMRVMTDPNKQVHQRLATGQIKMGNLKPKKIKGNLSSKSIENAGSNGNLGSGLHSWLKTGGSKATNQWGKIVAMTHKSNKAIVHVQHKDAAGLHMHAHVDASHMGDFEDMHFSFNKGATVTNNLKTINQGTGLYGDFVKGKKIESKKSLKELNSWITDNSSNALTMTPENIFSDVWNDVTNIVMTVGHAIEEGVESTIHFVVAVEDKLCHLAISAADEIAAVLTKIYDTIKLAITDLIDFIKFLIELLEDVGPMANAIAQTTIDAVGYFDGKLDTFVKDDVSKFFNVLDLPAPQTYTPSSSSNSDIDSAFEKFHWLMNLITQGATDSNSTGSDQLASDIEKAISDEIGILFKDIEALTGTVEDCFKDPKNAGSILTDFLAKLAGGFEGPIEGLVDEITKDLATSIKSTLTGDFPGLPSGVSGFFDDIGLDLSPAHVLGLLVGLPSTMLYGIVKGDVPSPPTTFWPSGISNELTLTATPAASAQATFIQAIGMITDLFAAVASPLTIVNAKNSGGDDSKFLALFSGLGKLAGSTISALTAATDWKGNENALIYRDSMIGLSLFRGVWGIYAYRNKVPKTNCAIDMLLGSVKIACGVFMLQGDLKSIHNNTTKALIQFAEGTGLVCELDGFVDLGGADAVFIGGAAIAPLVGSGARLYLLAES